MRTPSSIQRRYRQSGVSLLEVALIVVLLVSAAAVAIVWLRADMPRQEADAQVEALRWADEALVTFSATHGRLPCPASVPGGSENCSETGGGSGKGYLPAESLRLVAAGFAPGAERLRYVVGGTPDAPLFEARNLFEPTSAFKPNDYRLLGVWDEDLFGANEVTSFDAFEFGHQNELDFCVALERARQATPSTAFAHVRLDGEVVIPVAYAIAAPGLIDADNNGSLFDDMNADAGMEIAHPARSPSLDYDDRTLARDFASLSAGIGCDQSLSSVDAIAIAVSATDELAAMKLALRDAAKFTVVASFIQDGMSATFMVLSSIALYKAYAVMTAAASLLAGAISSCVFIIGCLFIGPYAAALAAAIASIALSIIAIAIHASALVLAILLNIDSIKVFNATGGQAETATDPAVFAEMVELVCSPIPDLQQALFDAEADLRESNNATAAALVAMDARWDETVALADSIRAREQQAIDDWNELPEEDEDGNGRGPRPPDPVDRRPAIEAMRAAGDTFNAAMLNRDEAQAAHDIAVRTRDSVAEALASARAELAATSDASEIERLQAAVADLEQQLADSEAAVSAGASVLGSAESALSAAQSSLHSTRAAAIDAFPPSDRSTATANIDAFLDAQKTWAGHDYLRQQRQAQRDNIAARFEEVLRQCAEIQAIANGEASPGQDAPVWNGARGILERADRRGALQ
jgi:hypothetical protein